jgi:hypothetical protein
VFGRHFANSKLHFAVTAPCLRIEVIWFFFYPADKFRHLWVSAQSLGT